MNVHIRIPMNKRSQNYSPIVITKKAYQRMTFRLAVLVLTSTLFIIKYIGLLTQYSLQPYSKQLPKYEINLPWFLIFITFKESLSLI